MCRAKAGDCDVAETCDGVSGACPPDGYLSYGTLCNASSGACTQSAVCSGYNAKCPDAAQKAVGAACDDGNPCTSPDTCDALGQCLGPASGAGGACECQVDSDCADSAQACGVPSCVNNKCEYAPRSAGFVCRAAVSGGCDVEEACDGQTTTCPVDGVRTAGTVCRVLGGVCDALELCDGVTSQCPADSYKAAGTLCRESAGACDVAESCTGASASCPANVYQNATVECRAAVGVCHVAENCSGSSASCPPDAFAASRASVVRQRKKKARKKNKIKK